MLGIILAAGQGTRIQHSIDTPHKALVPMPGGQRLIDFPLQNLVAAGATELCVVTGHGSSAVQAYIGEAYAGTPVTYIQNPYYEMHGAGYSLACAHEQMQGHEKILISDADIICSKEAVAALVQADQSAFLLKTAQDFNDGVIALGTKSIQRFVFRRHGDKPVREQLGENASVLGESMQTYCLHGRVAQRFQAVCAHIKAQTNHDTANPISNLCPINQILLFESIMPVFSPDTVWFNVNTANVLNAATSFVDYQQRQTL